MWEGLPPGAGGRAYWWGRVRPCQCRTLATRCADTEACSTSAAFRLAASPRRSWRPVALRETHGPRAAALTDRYMCCHSRDLPTCCRARSHRRPLDVRSRCRRPCALSSRRAAGAVEFMGRLSTPHGRFTETLGAGLHHLVTFAPSTSSGVRSQTTSIHLAQNAPRSLPLSSGSVSSTRNVRKSSPPSRRWNSATPG
jgi:hypothetical protein